MAKTRTILGLAFEDDRLRIAEVRLGSAGPRLQHSGVLVWSAAKALNQVTESAEQLRSFLKEHRMTAKNVVVGLPTKWLITKELHLPPAPTEALQGMLRLQAERAFSLDSQDLALDYMGPVKQGATTGVLLMGTQRRRLDQILTLLKTVGLEVQTVTSTSLCLRRLDREGHQGLFIGEDGIETWPVRTSLPQLRFTDTPTQALLDHQELKSQIKRLLLLAEPQPEDGPQGISLYTHGPLDEDSFANLCRSMNGHAVLLNGDSWLEQAGFSRNSLQQAGPARMAAALPLAPSRESGLAVDFLHSAMTQKVKKSHPRAILWSTVAAVVLVVLIAVAWYDAASNLKDIATYKNQLSTMTDDVTAAQALVDRVTYAVRWTERKPEFLTYLKQLTETFPEEGLVWVTSLGIAANHEAVVTGQAGDEAPVLQVLDAIKAQAHFDQVKLHKLSFTGRNTQEVSFEIRLRFKGAP